LFCAADLEDLKLELVLDAHRVSKDDLLRRYGTDLRRGLTAEAAKEAAERNGPNTLSPPPTTSGGLSYNH